MPNDTHKRKNNGVKIDDLAFDNKRPKKQVPLQEKTNTFVPGTKRVQKNLPINAGPKEDKRGSYSFRLSSEPKRFVESFSSSTKGTHQILIRDETLDGDTSCSSQEVDFIPGNSRTFSDGKFDVSASSSESLSSSSERNVLHLSCEENLGEGESMNPDRPLSANEHHRKDSDFVLTERNLVRKTLSISLISPVKTGDLFDLLPEELLVFIFRYLPLLSRERVSQVSKQWNYICKQFGLLELFPTDIYGMMIRNMRKHAKSMTNYFKSYIHVELNSEMRAILVDWLIEVCEECEMDSETLFLTVNYIDRYLSAIGSPIPRHRLQLLGMTSLLIAAKYEEMVIPTIADLIYLSDNSYTREEVTGMEGNVLNILKFDITVFTVKRFVDFFVHLLFEEASVINKSKKAQVSEIAHYFAEVSLLSYEMAISRPDLVASAIISIALNACGLPAWPQVLKLEAGFSHVELENTISSLIQLQTSLVNSKLQSIKNKQRFSPMHSIHFPEMVYM